MAGMFARRGEAQTREAGARTLAFTVDLAVPGLRLRDFRNLTSKVADPNKLDTYRAFVEAQIDPSVTWDDIRWRREQWQGQLLPKGVLEPEDALSAANSMEWPPASANYQPWRRHVRCGRPRA